MNKITIIIGILVSQFSFAQNIYPPTGPVGIGTSTPNSLFLLDVNGKAAVRSLFYVNDIMGGDGGDIRIGPNTGRNSSTIFMVGGVNPTEVMRVNFNKNVGIGSLDPTEKLTIAGGHRDTRLLLHSSGSGATAGEADLMLWASEPGLGYTGVGIGNNIHNYTTSNGLLKLLNPAKGGSYIRLLDNEMTFNVVSATGADKKTISIDTNGSVGIGDFASSSSLIVNGKTVFIPFKNADGAKRTLTIDHAVSNSPFVNNDYPVVLKTGGGNQPLILDAARIGVGTTNPDERLTIKGKIHAEEIRIDLSVPAPDYVFANDYKLKPLNEVENYIKENSHLPEIPSAKEIEKNGLMLAEMNMSLLKKIEELTLYAIEQNKIIQEQNKRLEKLEAKIK
jgi:hypothetical protein